MCNQTNRGEMITATSYICKVSKKTSGQHYLINFLASHLPKQDSQEQQLAPENQWLATMKLQSQMSNFGGIDQEKHGIIKNSNAQAFPYLSPKFTLNIPSNLLTHGENPW